ncbi:hypothetical protein BBP22_19935 [Bacillus paralicheniformis]|nr:hypothetical protein BBP22_19935 [Bacillus paralicheniformis]
MAIIAKTAAENSALYIEKISASLSLFLNILHPAPPPGKFIRKTGAGAPRSLFSILYMLIYHTFCNQIIKGDIGNFE